MNERKPTLEDAVMKTAMQKFQTIIPQKFHLDCELKCPYYTELVEMNVAYSYLDYNFLTSENKIAHFEFQSKNGGVRDLKRFHNYEISLSYQSGLEVITYVLFSGNIKNPMTTYKSGINTYHIIPITLNSQNGDSVLHKITTKLKRNIPLTQDDLLNLILSPLMKTASKENLIYKAVAISKKLEPTYGIDISIMLFALANKFLSGHNLDKVKEAMRMTELGRMLRDDGFHDGLSQGLERGAEKGAESKQFEIARNLLYKLKLSPEATSESVGLPLDVIETMVKEDNGYRST